MTWSPRAAWAARLNAVPFVDSAKAAALLDALGPDGLARAGDADWAGVSGASADSAVRWRRAALSFDPEAESRRVEAMGARLLVRGEPGYPALLAGAPDSPLVLYALGPLAEAPTVAVVGSRSPTAYGRRMAERLAEGLARRRVTVVSGLARGVDAEAHEAALDAGGVTWAVLGTSLGDPYPPENRDLFSRIAAEGGCVLSEYPFQFPGHKHAFARRNRVIAGLSQATVLVEGRCGSGALITARKAAEYGREVLAVPGLADSPLSEAPHTLLREGARVAARVEDVLAALPDGAPSGPRRGRRAGPRPEGDEGRVLALLQGEPLSLNELAMLSGLDMGRLSLIMFGLEIQDLVYTVPGQRYAKKTL